MNRRGFLTGIAGMLAAQQAAAFVPAGSLMKIVVPDRTILTATEIANEFFGAVEKIWSAGYVYVDPMAPEGGDGTIVRPINRLLDLKVCPGVVVMLKAGSVVPLPQGFFDRPNAPQRLGSYIDGPLPQDSRVTLLTVPPEHVSRRGKRSLTHRRDGEDQMRRGEEVISPAS